MVDKIVRQSGSNLRRGPGNPAWLKDPVTGKGRSGNPKGPPRKADCLISCIKDELAKKAINGVQTKEQLIAAVLLEMATKGNLKAIELVLEYTAVKPKTDSTVELKGGFKVIWDGNRNIAGNTPAAATP